MKVTWVGAILDVMNEIQRNVSRLTIEKVPRRSRNGPYVVLPSGPRVKTPAGLLTGDLRDENTGHLEREATGRRERAWERD